MKNTLFQEGLKSLSLSIDYTMLLENMTNVCRPNYLDSEDTLEKGYFKTLSLFVLIALALHLR